MLVLILCVVLCVYVDWLEGWRCLKCGVWMKEKGKKKR